jgi:predicted ribosome-associated RNA-binding protein Tma20
LPGVQEKQEGYLMMQRSLWLGVCGLAVAMFSATASAAEKVGSNSHGGTVVSAGGGKLVMTGKDKKEHSHDVLTSAKIMFDGKEAKLEDLKKGTTITVTTDKDGKVTAVSAASAAKKAGSNSHSGTVVSAAGDKLVMIGKDNNEHSHEVLASAKIMFDGKAVKLEDLKNGTAISVTVDQEGKVIAISGGTPKSKTSSGGQTVSIPAKVSK